VLKSTLAGFFSLLQPLHAHIYLVFLLGSSSAAVRSWCRLHPAAEEDPTELVRGPGLVLDMSPYKYTALQLL